MNRNELAEKVEMESSYGAKLAHIWDYLSSRPDQTEADVYAASVIMDLLQDTNHLDNVSEA